MYVRYFKNIVCEVRINSSILQIRNPRLKSLHKFPKLTCPVSGKIVTKTPDGMSPKSVFFLVYPWDLRSHESHAYRVCQKSAAQSRLSAGCLGSASVSWGCCKKARLLLSGTSPLSQVYSKVWAVAEVFSPHFEQQCTQRRGCDCGELGGSPSASTGWEPLALPRTCLIYDVVIRCRNQSADSKEV